jgi:DNA-binding MarR family transcriptional regulator
VRSKPTAAGRGSIEGARMTDAPDTLERHYLLLWLLVDELEPVTLRTLIDASGYSKSLVAEDLVEMEQRGYITSRYSPTDARAKLYETSSA